MLELVLAGMLGVSQPQQEAPDLKTLKTCVVHMMVVDIALMEDQWTGIPEAELPPPVSMFRTSGMILLADAFKRAAEREGIDVASLAHGIMTEALQTPRAESKHDVAMALKRESDCFRMVGAEEPAD